MNEVKKIIIAVPAYTGTLDCRFVDSLYNTLMATKDMYQLIPVYIPGDAMIQRARNDLFALTYYSMCDGIFWIDSDIFWNPIDFIQLVESKKHFIGGTYRRKTDDSEMYVLRYTKDFRKIEYEEKYYISVDGIGFGFCYMDRYCIEKLWKNSKKYTEKSVGKTEEKAMLFEIGLTENEITSEDIFVCKKWIKLKEKVYFDVRVTVGHVGSKLYTGNFENWLQRLQSELDKIEKEKKGDEKIL